MQNGIKIKEVKTMTRTVKGTTAQVMTIEDGQQAIREISVTETKEKPVKREIKKVLKGRDFLILSTKQFERKYFIDDETFFKYAVEVDDSTPTDGE